MIRADLHCHSWFSDGALSPRDLGFLALRQGLTHLALTDHDRVDHLLQAQKDFESVGGGRLILGVEISAYDYERGRKVHLLGYGFDPDRGNISALCGPLLAKRHQRTLEQAEILEKAGWPVSVQEVLDRTGGRTVAYKQHIMHILTEKKMADGLYGHTYKELFKGGGVCAGDILYVDVFQALEAIQSDGGLAVVAHPGQLDSWDVIPELAEAGLDGLESVHEDHTPELVDRAEALAGQLGLFTTGGSDWHGPLENSHLPGAYLSPAPGARRIVDFNGVLNGV